MERKRYGKRERKRRGKERAKGRGKGVKSLGFGGVNEKWLGGEGRGGGYRIYLNYSWNDLNTAPGSNH